MVAASHMAHFNNSAVHPSKEVEGRVAFDMSHCALGMQSVVSIARRLFRSEFLSTSNQTKHENSETHDTKKQQERICGNNAPRETTKGF